MSDPTTRREFFRQTFNPAPKGQTASRQPTTVTRNANLTAEQDASRFLAQATVGADYALIQHVANIGIENWIDQQMALPQSEVQQYVTDMFFDESLIGQQLPQQELFRYALWQTIMTGADLLRQKVALALSEIIVISTEMDAIYNSANGVARWYDMLLAHAFGNFRDLLQEVTISPMMGSYLSHAGNRKTDLSISRFPDENYARELMQLFTIGLFELNNDGSYKLDSNDEPIPTYDNSHITEFAKIFTGLTYDIDGDPHVWWTPTFESGWLNSYTSIRPMVMWEEEHEPGAKTLLDGYVVPNGQTGLQDITDALDHLFGHPNVGPFIGRQLIQRLVKSNPSAAYINRVANAFNDNGSGVRGDMQAVVKAILLDDEARNATHINDPNNGKLREPFFRLTQMLRALHFDNPQHLYWDAGWSVGNDLRQFMFTPPSVFNFFSPDFSPNGPVADAGLVGPEFQLLNSFTAISTINFWYSRIEWSYVFNLPSDSREFNGQTYSIDQPEPDLTYEISLLPDVEALIDHLDLVLTYGTLSDEMRGIIITAVNGYAATTSEHNRVVQMAIFLFMMCPEYAVQV